jgi:hypothetical protein
VLIFRGLKAFFDKSAGAGAEKIGVRFCSVFELHRAELRINLVYCFGYISSISPVG